MPGLEEDLAQEVIKKINKWLKEEGKNSYPRLAIKFCGGCNPHFDRGEVARLIKKAWGAGEWVSADENADLLLIINGCLSSCAQREEVEGKASSCLSINGDNISEIYKP